VSTSILSLYRRMTRWPAGRWLFARAVCAKAPYFGTIAPRFVSLEPGRCEIQMRDRRRVHNHLGTVHAIALCNLAELAAGVMTDATLQADMRWIPKGMTVEYLKKAIGTMHAIATPDIDIDSGPGNPAGGHDLPVTVLVSDPSGVVVFRARITMWVSTRGQPLRK